MSKSTKKPRTQVWKLILFFFCVFIVLDTGILALVMKEPVLLSGTVLSGAFAVLLFLSWRRTRPLDRVVKAGTPEEKLRALDRVADPKQLLKLAEVYEGPLQAAALEKYLRLAKAPDQQRLYRIAKTADAPVEETILAGITDPNVLLEAARGLDEFALRHLGPRELVRAATEPDFFRKTGNDYGHKQRVAAAQDLAVAALEDRDALLQLARSQAPVASAAMKKLLKVCPELAGSLYGDPTLTPARRDMAERALVAQTEQRLLDQPQTATALFLDRTLPDKARLAALARVPQEDLPSVYDPREPEAMRRKVVDRITDEAALAAVVEREPNKDVRLSAETRIKDPEKRKAYCRRDGAHAWVEVDSRWESYGDWHYEYITYRCPYCGAQRVDEGESRKD